MEFIMQNGSDFQNVQKTLDEILNTEHSAEYISYMRSRMQRRCNEAHNIFYERLINKTAPHLLTPIPSFSIAQFSYAGELTESIYIPKASYIRSEAVGEENTQCGFTTLYEMFLSPLEIVAVETEVAKTSSLRLFFELHPNTDLNNLNINDLPIYLSGKNAAFLYRILTAKKHNIVLKYFEQDSYSHEVEQHLISIRALSNSMQKTLLFKPISREIQDYFADPRTRMFVNINELGTAESPWRSHKFIIEINIATELQELTKVSKDDFQLNCVPVTNSYPATTEPLLMDPELNEYVIQIDKLRPQSVCLQQVNQLESISTYDAKRTVLTSKRHSQFNPNGCSLERYTLDNDLSAGTVLVLPCKKIDHDDILSCSIFANNGDYPHSYINSSSNLSVMSQYLNSVEVKLLEPCSKFCNSTFYSSDSSEFMSMTMQRLDQIHDVDSFKKFIQFFDWAKLPLHQRFFDAITEVNNDVIYVMQNGMAKRTLELSISVDELLLQGEYVRDQFYVFMEEICLFLRFYVTIGLDVQVKIIYQPSGKEYLWDHCKLV